MVGGLALALADRARAEQEQPAFTKGPLAADPFAKKFHAPPPGLVLPTAPLFDARGKRRLSELRGKIRLVSLWAEWCAPCIAEMADLAALSRRYQAKGFEVLAVLTSSNSKLTFSSAEELLKNRGAVLPLWIEAGGGDLLMNSLAMRKGQPSLPCNLIVDRTGAIRGRSFGASILYQEGSHPPQGQLSADDKVKLLAPGVKTSWSTEACSRFIDALIGGSLDS